MFNVASSEPWVNLLQIWGYMSPNLNSKLYCAVQYDCMKFKIQLCFLNVKIKNICFEKVCTSQVGHMRTNKACPLYQGSTPNPPLNVAMTEEQEEEIEKQLNEEPEDLVNVDGTKVKLSSKLLKVVLTMVNRAIEK